MQHIIAPFCSYVCYSVALITVPMREELVWIINSQPLPTSFTGELLIDFHPALLKEFINRIGTFLKWEI